jgi:gluconate 2-dehydrogenase gamma chain
MSENQVSRRELLRNIGISAALAGPGAGFVSAQVAQHGHEAVAREKDAAPKGEYQPKCFNAREFKTLERLSDLMIPADDHSPGALGAHAAEWIDYMASNSPELAEIFTGGFGWLDHHTQQHHAVDFVDAKPDEQTAVLDVIAFKKNETPENAPGIRFFSWARNLVTDAYYTSPIGIKDLGYMGNSAMSDFHVPEEALQYALKRSPFA